MIYWPVHTVHTAPCRGIFITGASLVGAAIREPRITSKNLIRWVAAFGGAIGCKGN